MTTNNEPKPNQPAGIGEKIRSLLRSGGGNLRKPRWVDLPSWQPSSS
jgi:hypothetical protein